MRLDRFDRLESARRARHRLEELRKLVSPPEHQPVLALAARLAPRLCGACEHRGECDGEDELTCLDLH